MTKYQRIAITLNNIRRTLLLVRDPAIRSEVYEVFNPKVIDGIADLLAAISEGPYVLRKSISTALKSIASKLRRHNRNISGELGLLDKLTPYIVRISIATSKITTASAIVSGFLRITRLKSKVTSSRYGPVYNVWMSFVKLLGLIQLAGLALSLRQAKQLSNELDNLANELSSEVR